MRKILLFLVLVPLFLPAYGFDENLASATVKIFNEHQSNRPQTPWEMTPVRRGNGSGVILDRGVILTNAHVVSNSRFLSIQKHNDPRRYLAEVIFAGHDCDLALIDVIENRDQFYEGVSFMEKGTMPGLREKVNTIGYPAGGNKLSVTEGVVSRIEYQTYSHDSNRRLLAVQTDAAINPGNSGGPVVRDGKLVGIAFQGAVRGQNIGYFIPLFVVEHFLENIKTGTYDGFPMAGFYYEELRNPALRKYLQVEEEHGIFVSSVVRNSPAWNRLKSGDVILSIDGMQIEEDGTVNTEWGYLDYTHLICRRQIGESSDFLIVRNGKKQTVTVEYFKWNPPVNRSSQYDMNFPYYIIAGYVFTPLSRDFLEAWGNEWFRDANPHQRHYFYNFDRLDDPRDEIIVLSRVLPDPVNMYTRAHAHSIISGVNGRTVRHFNELVSRLELLKEDARVDHILIELENVDKPLVIPKSELANADARVKAAYALPALRRVK